MKVRQMIVVATLAGVGVLAPASAAMASHPEPTTKQDCMKGGFAEYETSLRADATQRFMNQGQCVSFVASGKA